MPLPGQNGGGRWGREVIQGSRIYRWQTSLRPRARVSCMKLRSLGGMGPTLLCVYIRVGISGECVMCACDVLAVIMGQERYLCPAIALLTAGRGFKQGSPMTIAVSRRGRVKNAGRCTHNSPDEAPMRFWWFFPPNVPLTQNCRGFVADVFYSVAQL